MKQTIKNQRLFFISLIGIVAVSLIMGTTYAYQTLTVEKTEGSDTTVTLNVGKLNVTFDLKCKDNETCDENNDNYDRINLSNTPLSTTYKNSDYVEFTLNTNDSTDDVAYQINLTEIDYGYITNGTKTQGCNNDTCIIDENFKYTVVEVADNHENVLSEGNFSDLSGTEYTLQLQSGIYNSINKGKSQTVRLYLWLKETDENQNNLENTYFNAKIEINSYFLTDINKDTLAYNIINNAKSGIEGRSVFTEPDDLPTTPAEDVSGENERILSYTEDDYTASTGEYSYYFRGNVEDNYVTFSGMCWRIVRIEGDGSIKLTLESQSPCSEDMEINYFIKIPGQTPNNNNIWGFTSVNHHHIGDYNDQYGIKYKLRNWFNFTENGERKNINSNAEKIVKEEEWCLGNTTNSYAYNSPYALLSAAAVVNYENDTEFYYEAAINLLGYGVAQKATLKCNGETDKSKIGALTADEVVFAGGKTNEGTENNYFYLRSDDYYATWWTLTRSHFDGARDYAFYVWSPNGSISTSDVYIWQGVRPALSLVSGVEIESGEGTKQNPYIINEG